MLVYLQYSMGTSSGVFDALVSFFISPMVILRTSENS